ncbi:MAG: right-handed parallel beta-helix repeat-containing protein [Phycisphaera sp.]|nr:right-handed parallel beta-helix repeat-containing protein [Phycisphaera sp.]
MRRQSTIIALAVTNSLTATSFAQTTRTVCAIGCDFQSINAAIAAADDGDIIQLSAETYTEGSPIDPLGKPVTLQGVTDDAGTPSSILDGGLAHRVLQCLSGESHETTFEDLVIRNGRHTNGAGMYNAGSSPAITNCLFVDNQCIGRGGGIYNAKSSSPTLVRTRLIRNRASSGGGIYNFDGSNPTLIDCRLEGNSAPTVGGGMTNWKACSPILIRCDFIDNKSDASPGGGGGAMYDYGSGKPELNSCSFVGNRSTNGAGIQVVSGDLILTDCLFKGNVAGVGGGICSRWADITATRCVFQENSSTDSGAAMAIARGTVILVECSFDGNAPSAITMDEDSSLQITKSPVVPGDLDQDGDFDEDDARLAMSMFDPGAATVKTVPAESDRR